MISVLPHNTNIVVITNYRTGSTAFCDIVAKKLRLINLDEAFHPQLKRKLPTRASQKTIIKIMPDHFDQPGAQDALSNAYVVGLTRKDLTSQIASFYVCHVSKHWHDVESRDRNDYTIDINTNEIEDQIQYILAMHYKYQTIKNLCQTEFTFENIKQELALSKYTEYKKPKNYDKIYSLVNQRLSEMFALKKRNQDC